MNEDKYMEVACELSKNAKFGQYLMGIVHNLNNPLTTVSGRLQMLQFKNPDLPYIEEINELFFAVNDMLNKFSQINGLDVHTQDRRSQLDRVLNHLDFFLMADSTYKHFINKEVASGQGVILEVAPDDLLLILLHLFQNAIDSLKLKDDDRRLFLTYEAKGDRLHFTLTDNGAGFKVSAAPAPENWGVTTKKDDWEKYKFPRLGIGLNLVDYTLKKYQGTLDIQSVDGDGTKICWDLPLWSPEQ